MCVHRVLELTDEEGLQLKSFILKSGFSNKFKGQNLVSQPCILTFLCYLGIRLIYNIIPLQFNEEKFV